MRVDLDAGGVVQLTMRARAATEVGEDGRVKVVAHFRAPDLLEALQGCGSIESMDGEIGFPPVRLSIDRGEVHRTPLWQREPAPGFRGSVVSHPLGVRELPVRRVTPMEVKFGAGAAGSWDRLVAAAERRDLWKGEPVESVHAPAPRRISTGDGPTEEDRPWLSRRGEWWAVDLTRWGGRRRTMRDPTDPGWPARGRRTRDRDEAERWWIEYVRRFHEVKAAPTARDLQLGAAPKPERVYPSPLERPKGGRPWRHRGMILNDGRRLLSRRVRRVRAKAVRRRLGIFRSWRHLEDAVWAGRLWIACAGRDAPSGAATGDAARKTPNPNSSRNRFSEGVGKEDTMASPENVRKCVTVTHPNAEKATGA